MLHDESERLRVVASYKKLNFDQYLEFQSIVSMAAEICQTPVALLTLLDEQSNFFISKVGVDLPAMPRNTSFCQYTIQQDDLMIVPDATLDERFNSNPLVHNNPNVRFYAGGTLTTNLGHRLGALCVLDVHPKILTSVEQKTLRMLTKQASYLLEVHMQQQQLNARLSEIELYHERFRQISYQQSHQVRGPLATIAGLINIIKEEGYSTVPEYMPMLEQAIKQLDENIHTIVGTTDSLSGIKNAAIA